LGKLNQMRVMVSGSLMTNLRLRVRHELGKLNQMRVMVGYVDSIAN